MLSFFFFFARETELFPRGALEYYTKKNMGWDYSKQEAEQWQLSERGGAQGDYREGVSWKATCAKCYSRQ